MTYLRQRRLEQHPQGLLRRPPFEKRPPPADRGARYQRPVGALKRDATALHHTQAVLHLRQDEVRMR